MSIDEFLTMLRASGSVIVMEPVTDWPGADAIDGLEDLLDDETPCGGVSLASSSLFPRVSTVGTQAAFLLRGIQIGRYPPDPDARFRPELREEMRRWLATLGR
jgi:hypothetical protein